MPLKSICPQPSGSARSEREPLRLARCALILAALLVTLPGIGVAEPDGHTISGRWLHDGLPKAGGTIEYKGEGSSVRGSMTTDADGRFAVDGLQPGQYVLQVDLLGDAGLDRERGLSSVRGGFVRQRVVLGWQDATADVATWSTTLSGTLHDTEGAPVSIALLWLERPGPPPNDWGPGEMRWSELTDADGYFEFRGMPPGRWRLAAQKSGFASAVAWIELSADQPSVYQDLILEAASPFTFRVVEPEGQVPSEVYATLTDRDDRTVSSEMLRPNESGRFVLDRAPAGSWRLWIRSGHSGTRSFEVEIPGHPEQPWKLPATGRIRLSGHEDPQVLSVRLTQDDGTTYRRPEGGLFDAQRPYRSTVRAPLGTWKIHVEGPDGYQWHGEVVVPPETDAIVELPSARPGSVR